MDSPDDVIRVYDHEEEPFKSFVEVYKDAKDKAMPRTRQFLMDYQIPTKFKWKAWRDADERRANQVRKLQKDRDYRKEQYLAELEKKKNKKKKPRKIKSRTLIVPGMELQEIVVNPTKPVKKRSSKKKAAVRHTEVPIYLFRILYLIY
jgi:hypothetical protein